MKKYLFLSLFQALFSCTRTESIQSGSYVPDAPLLTSDLMTPEVLWSFGRLADPKVSPDGKSVLYSVTFFNIEENKSYSDIYTVSTAGGEARRLTNSAHKESNAIWQPDGRKIGFLSAASGSAQTPPRIAGMARRKENWIALSFDQPKSFAAEIVAPLLEIPGRIATAWNIPIPIESRHFLSLGEGNRR